MLIEKGGFTLLVISNTVNAFIQIAILAVKSRNLVCDLQSAAHSYVQRLASVEC